MKTLLNLIWLVLAGFWMAIGYLFAGIVCCILIVTIPFGIASFRMANYALWPFGRTVIRRPTAGAGSTIGNIIWILVAGIWLAIGHLLSAVACFVTIIGIPFAIQHLKLAGIALAPIGKTIVDKEVAAAVRGENAQDVLNKHRKDA